MSLQKRDIDKAYCPAGLRQQFDDGGQVVPGQSSQEEGAAGGRRASSAGLHLGRFVREKQVGWIQRDPQEGERRKVSETLAKCECDREVAFNRFLKFKKKKNCQRTESRQFGRECLLCQTEGRECNVTIVYLTVAVWKGKFPRLPDMTVVFLCNTCKDTISTTTTGFYF